MSAEEEEEGPDPPEPPGMPAWVMTFADLMSLLMCFFVLLLSFSQMDLSKFKKVAGSMEKAFGVQREIVSYEIPKGTSIIAQEFSPGKPDPTPLVEIRQKTIEELNQTLDFDKIRSDGEKESNKKGKKSEVSGKKLQKEESNKQLKSPEENQTGVNEIAKMLAEALAQEILEGKVEIEAHNQRVIVRILEEGSFESGSAILKLGFIPVLQKIATLLEVIPGTIHVGGHTDNIPIATDRFRSNWELSSSRAVSVVHALLKKSQIDPNRITISGHAETRPIFPNDTREHRRYNRRIEMILVQGDEPNYQEIQDWNKPLEEESPAVPSPPTVQNPIEPEINGLNDALKTMGSPPELSPNQQQDP